MTASMPPVQVYRAYRLACHDANGSGEIARKAMPDLPDFRDAKWQAAHNAADLKKSVLEGKGKFMQPMKDKLSPADAEQMVAYVRTFEGGKQEVKPEPPKVPSGPTEPSVVTKPKGPPGKPPPPSPEMAERTRVATGLYRNYCLICHGADGRGAEMKASMPAIPDFTDRAWQQGVGTPQLTVSILDGKGALMPAFRGRVNDDQARDLAAYVRAFGPPRAAEAEGAPAAASDFEERFRRLHEQWEALQKQMKELEAKPPKP